MTDAAPARARKANPLGTQEIYERMITAIIENRLRPGMQLVEERLANIFNVGRTKIREATSRLVYEGVAVDIPNRGAFVASPTPAQALEVLATRRLIEPEIMRIVASNATGRQVAALRAHVNRETAARAGNGPKAIIPLSGEFHLLLADMAGNTVLARMLRELEVLTCLIIILYDNPDAPGCPYDDHILLVEAIEAHDPECAAMLMLHHLTHIEASLDLALPTDNDVQLEDAFR